MQNRYVGDIGDFGKYALLNALVGDNLRLGIVWYLNTDEEKNNDGSRIHYEHLEHCDPALYKTLAQLRRSGRSVDAVQAAGVLPNRTIYCSAPISPIEDGKRTHPTIREKNRISWHRSAMEAMFEAELVFVDPDNGIAGKTVVSSKRNAAKYVLLEEIADYVQRGQSVVIYHHQTREKGGVESQIDKRLPPLLALRGVAEAWALIFRRQSVRAFIVVCCKKHRKRLRDHALAFQKTTWCAGEHFQLYAPTWEWRRSKLLKPCLGWPA